VPAVIVAAATQFGDFLIRAGALATGAGALGASTALVLGAFARDLGRETDHWELASRGAALGALFGVVYALAELIPWS
jgi:hypothetical protein